MIPALPVVYRNINMSKNTFVPHFLMRDGEVKTGGSLIVGLNHHAAPVSPPRMRLDDLYTNRAALQRQKSDDFLRRYQPKTDGKPFESPLHAKEKHRSPEDKWQFNRKFDDNQRLRVPQSRPLASSKDTKKDSLLSTCRSEKALPSFLRNQQQRKSPQKSHSQPTLRRQNFKILKQMGEGRFGTVSLAYQITTGMIVALKTMKKSKIIQDNMLNQFIRELKIQSFLDHPNIIKNFGYFADKEHFYIIMELGCDGQVYDIISSGTRLSEDSTAFIIGNLLEAVGAMHKHKILHRDIKPQNIVLVHGSVKLCDFGWAVNKKEELRSTFCGTPLYLSPELLQGQRYDEKVDLWSVGILAYELHLGSTPFDIEDHQDLVKIVTEDVQFPANRAVSPQFRDFIISILRKNPKERLTCEQLLSLPFIRNVREMETCEQLCQ